MIKDDYKAVFESDAGQRVLKHIVAVSGFMGTDMSIDSEGRSDAMRTAYNNGRRDVAGQILAMCDATLTPFTRPKQPKADR